MSGDQMRAVVDQDRPRPIVNERALVRFVLGPGGMNMEPQGDVVEQLRTSLFLLQDTVEPRGFPKCRFTTLGACLACVVRAMLQGARLEDLGIYPHEQVPK